MNGEWAEGWKDKTFTVALTNYMATTDRPSEDLHNPFTGWADTSRLISSDRIDNEWAYKVLTAEAGQNGGLLSFDTSPHYINQAYTGPVYTEDSGDQDDPGQGETTDPTDPAAPGQDSSSGQGSGNSKNGSSKNSSSGSTKNPDQAAKTAAAKTGLPKRLLPAVRKEKHRRPAIQIIPSSGKHWLSSPHWGLP